MDWLDNHLPPMRCDRGCDRCCGFVTCTAGEFDRIMAFANERDIEPARQGSACPFYQEGRCAVHPVRPFTCRLFGHVDDPALTCPRGYNRNLPPRLHRALRARYDRLCASEGTRHIHEAAYAAAEVAQLVLAELNPAASPEVAE
ncbi:MAG: YkgJ family cysteine cluster protein [Phycisphaerales bacterium]|nr:MAG: YkgJ family cysteine cluster protein [Phycisphaerales bacterium]